MPKMFTFTLHKFGALHDGRRICLVSTSLYWARVDAEAIYPGYHIEEA